MVLQKLLWFIPFVGGVWVEFTLLGFWYGQASTGASYVELSIALEEEILFFTCLYLLFTDETRSVVPSLL